MATDNDIAELRKEFQERILGLEARLAEYEKKGHYDSWLHLINAMVNQIKTQLENQQWSEPPMRIPDRNDAGGPEFVCDGNSSHTSTDCKKTLERQPGTGDHKNELQLVNADGLGDSTKGNIPYIDIDSSGNGELAWVTPDTDYQVLQRKSDDSIGFDWVRAH